MSDMKLMLPIQDTFTVTAQTIDKLIRVGDGDAALLYLYIIRTSGRNTTDEAAAALGKTIGEITTALAVLSRLGLVQFEGIAGEAGDGTAEETDAAGFDNMLPEEPRQYTIEEMKLELTAGSAFSYVVEETQRSLGKILSPDDLLRLFGIYDALRLPPEVILLLITHCIAESRRTGDGRPPPMRYIEKAAYTWEREGIFTLERAEEYLKELEMQKSVRGEIKAVLQIRNRELSKTEQSYVDVWVAMGFDAGAIGIAYDKTILNTGHLKWGYIDKIIKSWHSRGLHTPQEIIEKENNQKKNANRLSPKDSEKVFSAPNPDDVERMERLLKKIKEE